MIIDIGSGHKPYSKADILLEYKNAGNDERWNKDIVADRPTIIYEGLSIPFHDKSFDFSICRHVVEHVKTPGAFLKEIERISKGGYIETPTEIAELVFTTYDKHLWILDLVDNTLIIRNKLFQNTSKFGKLFDYLCENEKGFEDFFYWKRRSLFFIEYYWNKVIDFKIVKENENLLIDLSDHNILERITKLNKKNRGLTIPIKKRRATGKEVDRFLLQSLRTPCCNADILYSKNTYKCINCSKEFKRKGMIIYMYL